MAFIWCLDLKNHTETETYNNRNVPHDADLISKVKTSTICRLHLCIGTTCEINLVRPTVLAVIGLLSFPVSTARYH